jgi:antitoxin ParD1/3/4
MSVAFPPEIETFVARELEAGKFSSRDELIIAAVDLLRRRKADHEALRQEIEKGMEGEGIPAEKVFAELKAKYAAMAEKTAP